MTGVVASIVQAFYAYRVYVVSKRSLALPILITFFSAVQLGAFSRSLHRRLPVLTLRRPGFACGATGMVFKLKDFAKFQSWTYGGEERAGGAEIAIDNLSPSPTLPFSLSFPLSYDLARIRGSLRYSHHRFSRIPLAQE